ncbi:OmpW family outer membrane protein [Dyadobacter sp. LHD-138]|uniref:OmpW family outer membrane protein n=1 Tax=Dyadobacter sp. LHD-138 TaxID=3071413 RepID=UPI0027E0C496|nr:OmpW family outer membrane protein [Dyadobacter sp. LHD-138]MDQ6482483.1 OmpW family outer membrane protein [Dyadobacter sp. LHD-138]
MKTFLIRLTGVTALLLLLHSAGFAQLSLGLQGGVAKSDLSDSKTIAGGGVNLRVFASPNFAIGVAGKIYTDGTDYRVAGQTLSYNGTLIPVTGTLDYFFLTGAIRPYLGGDAGVYLSKYDAKFNGEKIAASKNHTNFGAAPRIGVVFALSDNIGLQVEGIYHFIFGNKDNSANTGNAGNVDFESTKQFGGINVGLIFGIGKK